MAWQGVRVWAKAGAALQCKALLCIGFTWIMSMQDSPSDWSIHVVDGITSA